MAKTQQQFKRWDEYVDEADHPDFEIPVDGERTIHVKAPTGGQIMAMQEVVTRGGDVREQLRIIVGGAADELLPLLEAAPAGVMTAITEDIVRHFGLDTGESPASSS